MRAHAASALRTWTDDTIEAVLARRKTTDVTLTLAAPRLLLPRDLADPRCAVLIVDMGEIAISSAFGDGGAAKEAAEGSSAAESDARAGGEALGEDEAPAALYDRYELEARSVQVTRARRPQTALPTRIPRHRAARSSAAGDARTCGRRLAERRGGHA